MKGKPDVELRAEWETVGGTLDAFLEEHVGADAANDKGKGKVAAVLTRCIALMDAATTADKAVRATRTALDRQVFDRYATLTDAEIRMLAVDDKWLAGIRDAIDGAVRR